MPLKIIKTRRDYNRWVANEMLEDYALRFAPRSFRRWSIFQVANTAFGAVAFLALEAMGGLITLNYGFINAFWAILVVGLFIFLTGLPIGYYASKYSIDIDLLTRGAGFGYIGSTITSLIYAAFTFILFALEAAIMALALELYFAVPTVAAYLISSFGIIPLVMYGITWISRFQLLTQPIWLILLLLPYVAVLSKEPGLIAELATFEGRWGNGSQFNPLLFGAASTVLLVLIAQIGEQADFLRFLPEKTSANRYRWWSAMLLAGPGWILLGIVKQLGGALLAFLALQHHIAPHKAAEPTQMYLIGFQYAFHRPEYALLATTALILISQAKINVTNAYAGSLAWSNFFSRLTHRHPGRVVWLVLNVAIAFLLMTLGIFETFEKVLGLYANLAIAWIGAVVADLVINKPLGLSPPQIEFRRAYLFDINPVGVGSMFMASVASMAAYLGLFGKMAQAFAPFIALALALALSPLIAWASGGRYYIARRTEPDPKDPRALCCVCGNPFEREDTAFCPAYQGTICSLCCTLDARCQDACKPKAALSENLAQLAARCLPIQLSPKAHGRIGEFFLIFLTLAGLIGMLVFFVYSQQTLMIENAATLKEGFLHLYIGLCVAAAMGTWWIVLSNESRRAAQSESNAQTFLLLKEVEEHRKTDDKLHRAKELAEAANQAKSRFLSQMSHELRSPLNAILGYTQLLIQDSGIPKHRKSSLEVIQHSGEHLLTLIDDILDIAKIEARKLQINQVEIDFTALIKQLTEMFKIDAERKGLRFRCELPSSMPAAVRGDEKRIRQILINLLHNAIKFTSQGEVVFQLSYANQIARFEIRDSGKGIAQEDVERIFEPFQRAADSSQHEGSLPGAGLGLTISKALAELMGGELSVESTADIGSIFRLRLFLPEISRTGKKEPELPITGYRGAPKKLLVVDDQPEQKELLVNMLRPLGFDIQTAHDGKACLAAALIWKPDLILLDFSMPDMNGHQVIDELRRRQNFPGKIVIVSANAFAADRQGAATSGCHDWLIKPVRLERLLEVLERHLAIHWRHDQALPPQPCLQALMEHARIGHARGFKEALEEIDQLGDPYQPFTNLLKHMAQTYRFKEITALIEKRLTEGPFHEG